LLVTKFFHYENAWRIPFLIGGGFALVGYFLRQYLVESPEFISFKSSLRYQVSNKPSSLREILNNRRSFALVFAIGCQWQSKSAPEGGVKVHHFSP